MVQQSESEWWCSSSGITNIVQVLDSDDMQSLGQPHLTCKTWMENMCVCAFEQAVGNEKIERLATL